MVGRTGGKVSRPALSMAPSSVAKTFYLIRSYPGRDEEGWHISDVGSGKYTQKQR